MGTNKHSFQGQEFFEEQCRKNDELKYMWQKGGNIEVKRKCAYCGSEDYYAKNYCRCCYNRVLRGRNLERRYETEADYKIQKRLVEEKRAEPFEVKVCRKAFNLPHPLEIPDESLKKTIDMMGALTDKQTYIITRHYKDGVTLGVISKEIGVTRERVRQLEMKAMRKISSGAKDVNRVTINRKDASVFCGYSMSARSVNALKKNHIQTMKQLGDLIASGSVNSIPGVGVKSANEMLLIFTDWYYNRG